MATRNLLAISKLEDFKAWLDVQGIEHRATNADFQVLQVRLPGTTQWHAIYQKLHAKVHLSVPTPLNDLVEEFVFGKVTSIDETKLKPIGEEASYQLPWKD